MPKESSNVEFWESTESMPWNIWAKIHKTGDFTQVCKNGNPTLFECLDQWYYLQDEWIEKFGYHSDYEDLLQSKKDLCLKLIEYLQTGDRFLEFEASVLKEEIKNLETNKKTGSLANEKAKLMRLTGLRIDKTWTVDEYYYQKQEVTNG